MTDTIAAIATGYARTAIGILRISGPEARQVLAKVFTPFAGKTPLLERPAQSLIYGQLHDANGAVLDNCLATFSVAPASYTGEDTAELQCHGLPHHAGRWPGSVVRRRVRGRPRRGNLPAAPS